MKKKDLLGQRPPSKKGNKRAYEKYSYGLKRKVVYEIESGYLSFEEARRSNGIKSKSIIYNWLKRYGRMEYDPKKAYKFKESPQEEIKRLKAELEESNLHRDLLLDMQQIYEEDYGVEVKKYMSEQLIKEYQRHKRKV